MRIEIKTEAAECAAKEEVLLSKLDTACGCAVPVKLITYPDGTMDLFRQGGNQFAEHIALARTLLAARGLVVGEVDATISSGAYLAVWPTMASLPDALVADRENPLTLAMTPFTGHAALVDLVYA